MKHKNRCFRICFFLFVLVNFACQDEDVLIIDTLENRLASTDVTSHTDSRYFINAPLPVGKGSLRVLCIGNSYTLDALGQVASILQATDLEPSSFSVYSLTYSASTLKHWCDVVDDNKQLNLICHAGSQMPVETGTLKELLAQDWDVITLQQFSGYAFNYKTFNPWLRRLIDLIHQYCPNPNVTLAWQTAWSYCGGFSGSMSSYERWLLIALAVQQMVMSDGIDVLIPEGTAIQNARNTSLNTEAELTRDGTHLDLGIGRYVAACTWLQSIFAPVFGISILGNKALPEVITQSEGDFDSHPVTEDNRDLAQRCAVAAVVAPFAITPIYEE